MHLARHLSSLALALAAGAPASDAVWVVQSEGDTTTRRSRIASPTVAATAPHAGAAGAAHARAPSPVTTLTVTSGWVVSAGGDDGVGGIQLTAWTADGALAGVAFSASDGSFELVTAAGEPLLLNVVGTGVGVPFVPGESLAIVVP